MWSISKTIEGQKEKGVEGRWFSRHEMHGLSSAYFIARCNNVTGSLMEKAEWRMWI